MPDAGDVARGRGGNRRQVPPIAVATRRSRIGHRLLLKMGLRKEGFSPMFDQAHKNYTWLKMYVEEMQESLSAYALQLARMTEAARAVGDDASHLYRVEDPGFKPVVALKEAQDKGHRGYAGQLQQAFVKGIIEPVGEWHRELESLENLVTDFNEIRVQHDHYRLKVEDLAQKAKTLEARATSRGDSKDAKAAAAKLKSRNTVKLNQVTAEYNKRLRSCCGRMTQAWEERGKMMNGIVARIIHFQESYFAEQLMNGLGVSRILREAEGTGPRWGGTSGIEPFVPKGHVRHYEGELLKKHVLIKERMWYRLVGSSLEAYNVKSKDDDVLYVVTETPIAVYEVKGVSRISDVNFRVVTTTTSDGTLNLYAHDEADAKGWMDALANASTWDQLSSSLKVQNSVRESRAFLNRCKKAHTNTTTTAGLEQDLGVTEALANPPPPPADRPDVKSYTVAGGGALAASGGGGGQEASSTGGGSKAAGIAAGGEAGVAAAAVTAAAAAAAAGGKGKKGKKGDGEIPELVTVNEKKKGAGGGGGAGLPPGLTGGGRGGPGIGGIFPGRTGRQGMGSMGSMGGMGGMMAGAATGAAAGIPFGMMGGAGPRMNPPSFSGASSSFGGSTHSSISGFGAEPQMGDPRLRMAQQQQMGMSGGSVGGMPGMNPPFGPGPPQQMSRPQLNPTTGLPVGMTQSGPAIVLPPGMMPRGGGPVINPPAPPTVMNPSMAGSMGAGGGPGSAVWGGAQQSGTWGASGLPQTRSFGSRFGLKQGIRQQGFRRSSSFGDKNMGPGGFVAGGGPYDDMMGYGGSKLSPMMEDDSFDTQSTKSVPSFGATAAVGEAAAAAAAASAAAARAAAGVGGKAGGKKGSVTVTEESKSSSSSSTKKKGGGEGAAAAKAAAAAAAASSVAAVAAARHAVAASPPAHVPVMIQTVRPKKPTPEAAGSSVMVVEETSTPSTTTTTTTLATSSVTQDKKAAAAPAAPVVAAAAPTTPVAPAVAAADTPFSPDRGDDGGLSRYGTSGETPARVRGKSTSTWKRMMSLGGVSTSSKSYRYNSEDVTGPAGADEAKHYAEEAAEADRIRTASSIKKARPDRWSSLRRTKSSVSNTSPPRGSSLDPSASSPLNRRGRAAATTVAERKSERRSSSTGRNTRASTRSSVRSFVSGGKAAAGSKASNALVSPSEDVDLEDDFKPAPPLSRDETSIGRSTRASRSKKAAPGKGQAKQAAKEAKQAAKEAKQAAKKAKQSTDAAAATEPVTTVSTTSAKTAATAAAAASATAAAAATARESSAAAIRKAGVQSASSGAASESSSAPAGGDVAPVGNPMEAPSVTVVTASDTAARTAIPTTPVVCPVPPVSTTADVTAQTVIVTTPVVRPTAPVSSAHSTDESSSEECSLPAVAAATVVTDSSGSTAAAVAVTTETDKAKQAVAETDKAKQAVAETDKAKQAVAEADKAKQATAEADKAKQSAAEGDKAKEAAAKYAAERKESVEAAKRVDGSTGIMKNLTLEEIMMRSDSQDDGGGGVTIGGSSTSGGGVGDGNNFDVAVPAVATLEGATASKITANSGGASDSAARSAASGATVVNSSSNIPAKKPRVPAPPAKAGGCEAFTPAHFASLAAATTAALAVADPPVAAAPPTVASSTTTAAALTPRTAATAAAEASSQAAAAASAASAAVAAAVAADNSPESIGISGGGGSALTPPTPRGYAAATSVMPAAPSPDTPGSTGSGAQVAAQAKVFQRLCDSSGSEAETGDAGGGLGGGATHGDESTLSFQQLMGWDEVQELLEYGALKEGELTSLWQEAVGAQEAERGTGDQAAHIWGTTTGIAPAVAPSDGSRGSRGTKEVLTQRGFMILVKLIEELQFEKELEQDKGVGLAPGRVCVV
ncbi:unnamed protein product [Pylaiella littoralis]